MKKLSKILAVIIAVLLLSLVTVTVFASTATASEGLEYSENADGTYTVVGRGTCVDAEVVIPATYNGKAVTAIADKAFYNRDNITSVTIPESITSIGGYAFAGCGALTSISVDAANTVYSSVGGNLYNKAATTLIQYAVGKTDATFEIPETVTTVGYHAFYQAKNLTSVTIPASVSVIESTVIDDADTPVVDSNGQGVAVLQTAAFSECTSITDVYYNGYRSGWEAIEIGIGNECITTAEIHYNDHTHDIVSYPAKAATCTEGGYTAYEVCTKCTYATEYTVTSPLGHEYVNGACSVCGQDAVVNEDLIFVKKADGTFAVSGINPTSIIDVVIPETYSGSAVTSIESSAFEGTNVRTVTIPASITVIGDYAFNKCTSLVRFNVAEENTAFKSIDGNLYTKDGKILVQYAIGKSDASFEIPAGVTVIGRSAFAFCSYITEITIPDSVMQILGRDDISDNDAPFIDVNGTASTSRYSVSAFTECVNLVKVNYASSEEAFAMIQIAPGNAILLNAEKTFTEGGHVHTLTTYEGKAATCTEAGWAEYVVCSTCGFSSYQEIPALGHSEVIHKAQAPDCDSVGWNDYVSCTRCDYSTYVEIPALGHTETEHPAKAATCTDIGWDAYVTCSVCDYTTYVEIPALGHDEVTVPAQAPTCDSVGWAEYVKCTRCDYSTYVEIPAAGHEMGTIPAKAPDCTNVGWDEHTACVVCGYGDFETIPALGHDEVTVPAAAPDCENIGWDEHVRCSRCDYNTRVDIPALGHVFVNGVCTVCGGNIQKENEFVFVRNTDGTYTLQSIGSYTGTDVVVPATYLGSAVTAIAGGAFEDTGIVTVTIPASVTFIGEYAFNNCTSLVSITVADGNTAFKSTDGNLYTKDGKTLIQYAIGKTATDFVIPEGVTTIGRSAFAFCTSLKNITIPVSVTEILGHEDVSEMDSPLVGMIPGVSASKFNVSAFSGTKITDVYYGADMAAWAAISVADGNSTLLNAAIHTSGEGQHVHTLTSYAGKAATCTAMGWADYVVCSECGYTTYEEIAPLEHDIISHEALIPTCTEPGHMAYETCSRCDYTTYHETAPYGHSEVIHAAVDATCTEGGHKSYVTCQRCDYTTYEATEALGHNEISYSAKAATCTESGYNAYVICSRCDYSTYERIPATGHNYVDGVCTACGAADNSTSGLTFTKNADGTYTVAKSTFTGTELVIPSTYNGAAVTAIAASAFSGNKTITSVVIPASITTIGNSAFSSCTNLTSVTIGEGVTSLGQRTFYNCTSLTEVVIPESVETMGNYVFQNCTGLAKATFNAKAIGTYAFTGCSSLRIVRLGKSVEKVDNYAFNGCTSIALVEYEGSKVQWQSVEIVGPNGGNLYLAKARYIYLLDYPATVSSGFVFTSNGDGTCVITGIGTCKDTDVVIPYLSPAGDVVVGIDTPNNYGVFRNRTITSVVIPNTVTYLGASTFRSCKNLASVVLGDGLVTIGDQAFAFCSALTELILTDYVTSLGLNAFQNCTGIKNLVIGERMQVVGTYAFSGCTGIETVYIGRLVTTFEYNAFYNCKAIKTVTYNGTMSGWRSMIDLDAKGNPVIRVTTGNSVLLKIDPNSLTLVGHEHQLIYNPGKAPNCWDAGYADYLTCASCGYTNYTELAPVGHTYVDGICTFCGGTESGEGLVYRSNGDGTCMIMGIGDCTSTDIIIPSKSPAGDIVVRIANRAFNGCTQLTSIVIPDTVETIDIRAFSSCTNLKSITIGKNVKSIGSRAFYGTAITEINIPSSVERVEGYAFQNCKNLTTVTVDADFIGGYVFAGCPVETVYLGKNVSTIAYGCLSLCTTLTDIYYDGTEAEYLANVDVSANHAKQFAKLNFHFTDSEEDEEA